MYVQTSSAIAVVPPNIRSGLADVTKAQLATVSGSTAGGIIMALAPLAGPAAPFVIAGGALVAGLSALFAAVFSGCGATCVEATHIVDQVEAQYLKPNLANYMALATPRPAAAQQAALQVFDYAWSLVLQGCGDPALGDAGRRCISERAADGEVPGTGGNWFKWYRDPIANDSNVAPDSPLNGLQSTIESLVGPVSTNFWPLAAGGLILAGLLLGGSR